MDKRITVVVRIRPALQEERYEPLCARRADDGRTIIVNNEDAVGMPAAFQFDEVFDADDDQRTIYKESVQELLDYTLQGGNITILTYGQTGSGKTFTILGSMEGQNLTEKFGIFPRVFQDLLLYKKHVEDRLHVIILLSAVELYVDDVMDLLAKRKKLKLRETPEETLIQGVNTLEVKTMDDVLQIFEAANASRSVASTKMNDVSSRSHALFFVTIFQVSKDVCSQPPRMDQLVDENGVFCNGTIKGLVRSRVTLLDLAGSERVKRSGVEGQAMVEAQSINKSLSALGTTINAMYMGNSHIPFRDSRLTLLLKPSFIDKTSRLLLIGQISPPYSSALESQGTLRFCDRVKNLKVGKVATFPDLAEEERFLKILHQQEVLVAEMRIVGELFYHKPQCLSAVARLGNISVEQARSASVAALQRDAGRNLAQKEKEFLKEQEAKIISKEEEMLRAYADKMNKMIEEYELVAHEVKKEKKANKQRKKKHDEEHAERLAEAKKIKKQRLKLEEKVEQMRAELQNTEKMAIDIDLELKAIIDAEQKKPQSGSAETGSAQDEIIDMLLSCFCAHATEINGLHYSYVQRLGATQRQRSQVRRIKMLCSAIIIEETLVYDIIDFIVDRAVDISNGTISKDQGYSWNDIDGLSCLLRGGEKLYPPLLTASVASVDANEPSAYHNTTFLSSDESDEENSHNREKRRRVSHVDCDRHSLNSDKWQTDLEEADKPLAERETDQCWGTAEIMHKKLNMGKETNNHIIKSHSDNNEHNIGNGNKSDNTQGKQGVVERGNSVESVYTRDNTVASNEDGFLGDDNTAVAGDNSGFTGEGRQQTCGGKDQSYLMRVYDSPTLVIDLIKYLRGGTVMLKHGRTGKPHRRFFWVTVAQNQKMLRWAEPDAKNRVYHSAVDLDEVGSIQLGFFSRVLKRNAVPPTDPSFYRAFSIGLKGGGRTVDIVADSMPDFEAWVVGLSNLVRVDPVWGGKLDITKEDQFERLNCFEASLCESNHIYPAQYLSLKKRVLCLASRTLDALAQCGNDAKKAHELLRGIHLPAVNDKGAIYLTKGELRFIGQSEIDIIRITKIWILLQQMNLVYDENFIPATTFGITHRE